MNRFNLSFKGEIQPGKDPEQVKARFGKLFGIDDPQRLERFFSGETIILRRNLERKTAAEYFSKLRKLGVEAELVKVTAQEAAAALAPAPASPPPSPAKPAPAVENEDEEKTITRRPGMDREILQRRPGQVDQSWAVSGSRVQAKAAQRQVKKEEAERKAAEEAARRKAKEEDQRRKAEEQAARRKAEQEEAERRAAEEAARRKAEEQEQRRKAEEQAVRRKAEQEEAARKAAEEAARRKAEKEEARRKAQEEEARRKAAREEARRKAAEEAARKKAQREEQKRKAAEEAARKKAQREEQKRKAAEEAARRRAEEEEARHKAAEEAARQRAIEEEARRKAKEEEARRRAEEKARRAEEAARRAAEKAELERKKAEATAAKKAAEAEAKRKAAEEAARRREQLAEQKRLAEAQAAEQRAERERHEAEKQRKLKAEREAREQREKAAREQARREAAAAAAAEKARLEAAQREEQAQRKAMEEQAIQRAAQELSRQPSLQPVAAKVRTKLDLPQKQKSASRNGKSRQAGAPNLYTLKPFRNSTEVKSRVELSRQRMRRHLGVATVALAGLLVLAGAFLQMSPPVPVSGPGELAIIPGQGPVILAGEQLLIHDRAGVGSSQLQLSQLGVTDLSGPMTFTSDNEFLALGQLASDPGAATSLLRCELDTGSCSALPGQWEALQAFTLQPLDGSLLLADNSEGKLLHLDQAGDMLASAALKLPEQPVLRLESGLLFINSAEAPAISVFRYDKRAFGSQLDEVLLFPAPAVEAGQIQVRDFLFNAGSWWVSMENPDTGSSGVYRFDSNWDYLGQVNLEPGTTPDQLVAWGSKTLVLDRRKLPVQRFNAEGFAEAPLESELLQSLVDGQQSWRFISDTLWHAAFITAGLLTLGALLMAWLQGTRALVYKARKARGAQPIDDLAEDIQWIDPLPDRAGRFGRINITWAIISFGLVLVAIGAGISVIELGALLLVLAGFSWGLLLLQRSATGHIGVVQGQLLLVDHDDMYHLGRDARLQYRGPFLLIDDVVVFQGNALVPAFKPEQLKQQVTPVALGGIRVDRKTVLIKLLQGKHPLTQSAGIALAGSLLAAIMLAMHWL